MSFKNVLPNIVASVLTNKYFFIYLFPQGHFFDEYAMEGVSKEANEIYLEVAPDNIVKALKTASNAKWIKIKLTKKHVPCLTFEIDQVGGQKTKNVSIINTGISNDLYSIFHERLFRRINKQE